MRAFKLQRDVDCSGVSGTGVVAEGVEFPDGSCCLFWLSKHSSIGIYHSMEDLLFVHGHGNCTHIEWVEIRPPHAAEVMSSCSVGSSTSR